MPSVRHRRIPFRCGIHGKPIFLCIIILLQHTLYRTAKIVQKFSVILVDLRADLLYGMKHDCGISCTVFSTEFTFCMLFSTRICAMISG